MRDVRSIPMLMICGLLAACGGSSEPDTAADAPEPLGLTSGSDQGDAIAKARHDAQTATEAAGDMDPLAGLGDATAEEALTSYITACAAGEFIRAADFCHPDAPGTKMLISTGEGFKRASEDPSTAGMDIRGFLTQGFDQATHTVLEDGDERVAFEVTVPGKAPTRIEVTLIDGHWKVIPPDKSGLPAQ